MCRSDVVVAIGTTLYIEQHKLKAYPYWRIEIKRGRLPIVDVLHISVWRRILAFRLSLPAQVVTRFLLFFEFQHQSKTCLCEPITQILYLIYRYNESFCAPISAHSDLSSYCQPEEVYEGLSLRSFMTFSNCS